MDPCRAARLSRRRAVRMVGALPLLGAVVAMQISGRRDRFAAAADGETGLAGATPVGAATDCAGSPVAAASPVGSPAPKTTVRMTDEPRFAPESITVAVGDAITWINDSDLPHTATGDPEQNPVATSHPEYVQLPDGADPWGSPLLQPGESHRHTFTTPGEYRYVCIPHVLSGMRATITVTR